MTNNKNHNISANTSENQVSTGGQNIVSNNSQNSIEIVQKLDLIISQIGNQNTVTLSGKSKKNLEEESEGYRLY